MVEGAALLFSGQEEGNDARGDGLAKEDRTLQRSAFAKSRRPPTKNSLVELLFVGSVPRLFLTIFLE